MTVHHPRAHPGFHRASSLWSRGGNPHLSLCNGLDQSRQSRKERPRGSCSLLSSRDPPWNPSPSAHPGVQALHHLDTVVPHARTDHRGHPSWARPHRAAGATRESPTSPCGNRRHVHRVLASRCGGAAAAAPDGPSGAEAPPSRPCGSRAPVAEGLAVRGPSCPSGVAARSRPRSSRRRRGGPCARSSLQLGGRSHQEVVGRSQEDHRDPCGVAAGEDPCRACPCAGAGHDRHGSPNGRRGPAGPGRRRLASKGRRPCRGSRA